MAKPPFDFIKRLQAKRRQKKQNLQFGYKGKKRRGRKDDQAVIDDTESVLVEEQPVEETQDSSVGGMPVVVPSFTMDSDLTSFDYENEIRKVKEKEEELKANKKEYDFLKSGDESENIINDLDEEGEETKLSTAGFDRSTKKNIDLEIKSTFGSNININNLNEYLENKAAEIDSNFKKEFKNEMWFDYDKLDEMQLLTENEIEAANSIIDDYNEDLAKLKEDYEKIKSIIDDYNEILQKENKEAEKDGRNKYKAGEVVEDDNDVVYEFEYKKNEKGEIDRVLVATYDYDYLEDRFVRSGGYNSVEEYLATRNIEFGAYKPSRIKKGGVRAMEYPGMNIPKRIEREYWGKPILDNLGNEVVIQEKEIIGQPLREFVVEAKSTQWGGYTKEEFDKLPKDQRLEILKESRKKYEEKVGPRAKSDRRDFWEDIIFHGIMKLQQLRVEHGIPRLMYLMY